MWFPATVCELRNRSQLPSEEREGSFSHGVDARRSSPGWEQGVVAETSRYGAQTGRAEKK